MTNMRRQLSNSTKTKHPKYKRCNNNLDINAQYDHKESKRDCEQTSVTDRVNVRKL